MIILGLDSTAEVCSAALCEDEKLIAELTLNTGNTHSETLLPAIEQILRLADCTVDRIDLFACSAGPGSFTGVRIGASTLKGLAFGKKKPCVEVSTLEALAYNLSGYDGILCPVMNARRSQVYNALFSCRDGVIERLCPDRAISVTELEEELYGMDKDIYLSGDGYDLVFDGNKPARLKNVPIRQRYQSGYGVCRAGMRAYEEGRTVSDVEFTPKYLRLPQAERERRERLGL